MSPPEHEKENENEMDRLFYLNNREKKNEKDDDMDYIKDEYVKHRRVS